MECKKEKNMTHCSCTYEPCGRKGICCECVQYHLKNRELPGCFFPANAEKTYNRSIEYFVKTYKK
ncbi:MAG: cytosolic protein [Omnitrophica bacterium RBG_13_46_9]|nr:MAG: cytosolic protein [Omnitrophica bacterium RBG_13_46_9]